MKVHTSIIRATARALTLLPKALPIKVNGRKISSMAKAKSSGLMMVQATLVTSKMARSKAKASTFGLMVKSTQESGTIIESTVLANILGKTEENTMVSGMTTTCKASVSTSTLTESSTKVNTKEMQKWVMVIISGPTKECMKATGLKASSTDSVSILILKKE